jgi:hypothetical protein
MEVEKWDRTIFLVPEAKNALALLGNIHSKKLEQG